MTMPTNTPRSIAEALPSDAAIAQAFREAVALDAAAGLTNGYYTTIARRAAEIDAFPPVATGETGRMPQYVFVPDDAVVIARKLDALATANGAEVDAVAMLDALVYGLVDQQAMPDESWREPYAKLRAALAPSKKE